MPETFPLVDAAAIRRLVGPAAYERGRPYARHSVTGIHWNQDQQLLTGEVLGTEALPYECAVTLAPSGRGYEPTRAVCTCPVGFDCKHCAAVMLAGNARHLEDAPGQFSAPARARDTPTWRTTLAPIVDATTMPRTKHARPGMSPDFTPLALQFEVREKTRRPTSRWQRTNTTTVKATAASIGPLVLAIRPAVPGAKANRWVAGDVTWATIQYQLHRLDLAEAQVDWFRNLYALSRINQVGVPIGGGERLLLDDFASPLLWDLFAAAGGLGIRLVGSHPDAVVRVLPTISIGLAAERTEGGGILLAPHAEAEGEALDTAALSPISAHGAYAVTWSPQPTIALGPTSVALDRAQRRLLESGPIAVPADEVAEFLADYYPTLAQALPVTSGTSELALPQPQPPVLLLAARFGADTALTLDWSWEYRTGEHSRRLPLYPQRGEPGIRDVDAESATLTAVDAALGVALASSDGSVLTAERAAPAPNSTTLHGIDAAEFATRALPALEALDQVRVEVEGDKPDYRELTDTPSLTVTTVETDQNDWFDLGVIVTVDGRTIPFEPLFRALAKGQRKLLLIDKSYLSLQQPVFDGLRELILEAQALAEWETGPLKISRYQAGLWAEFEDLADESEQAVAWRDTVGGLLGIIDEDAPALASPTPLPDQLHAELRPYQFDGYQWLTFLWRNGLGGVLADDMGLGKTLQTLALVAHSQEHSRSAPFLVVAPSSVVANWAAEAARFTPQLKVAQVSQTRAKSRTALAEQLAGADLVITSYTLFRLDFEDYAALPWAGLILDEAQFVKNLASRAHRCARELRAPFKLAVTGTPLENNLMELWSMFDIVAPGLFPSSRRFTEEYVKPIAAAASPAHGTPPEHGAMLLGRLRRRIRPLMLRRTKEQVAPELPEKQEQILSVELAPRHRKLYDTFLQRERQKLLGLIDDLDRNRFIVFRSLTLLRMLSLDASLIDDAYASVPSSKLDALFEQLDDVLAEGHRTLIFSQFTSFLHKVADRLQQAGVDYAYLDGSTRRRAEVIARFKNGDAPVFLISLKAGGFGLNLTEADYVFLLDPWWNPASEAQAIDRTHRIGQAKNVMVYRLVAEGTIEEKVMALKAQKAKLFDAVLDEDAAFSSALTADDVRALLE